MYGLINMAVKQLVVDNFGEIGWDKVREEAGVKENYFDMLGIYPDHITYQLVDGATKVTGKSSAEVLELFGSYWIKYAANAGYGPLLDLFGPNFKECLLNLNRMHEHMGSMMPGLVPPAFEIEKEITPNEYIVLYSSTRKGLGPMVIGLLKGLGERYCVKVEVQTLGQGKENNSERYQIQWK